MEFASKDCAYGIAVSEGSSSGAMTGGRSEHVEPAQIEETVRGSERGGHAFTGSSTSEYQRATEEGELVGDDDIWRVSVPHLGGETGLECG